uniref:Uncharacterized protein n=1 Tax=Octopus bimaculoides TaxID=37653 RepID=A0A0L8GJ47_OCTBM
MMKVVLRMITTTTTLIIISNFGRKSQNDKEEDSAQWQLILKGIQSNTTISAGTNLYILYERS